MVSALARARRGVSGGAGSGRGAPAAGSTVRTSGRRGSGAGPACGGRRAGRLRLGVWLAWDGRGAAHHQGGRAACSARPRRPRAAAVAAARRRDRRRSCRRRPRRDAALATASPPSLPLLPAMRVRAPGHRWGASLARRGELGGGRARDEARTCSRPHACSRRRGRRARPSCGGRARVTAPAGGGEPRACSQSTTSSPAKAGAVKWSTRAQSTRGGGGWLGLTHVDGRCARCV